MSHEFYWCVHEDDVGRIRSGTEHPHATAILEAYDANQRMEQSWDKLSEYERELIVGIDNFDVALSGFSLSASVQRYLELEVAARMTYSQIQESQVLNIRSSIEVVRQWLVCNR